MTDKPSMLTIFLGTFNAEPYLKSMLDQIRFQEDQNFNLLVVDNNSSDNSYQILSEWQYIFKKKMTLVRNEKNIGVPANIYSNIDKFQTPWFCNFHQDDFYKSNHVRTMNELISDAQNNIVGVCSTMGSMSNDGKVLNSKPRASWFYTDLDQPGQFLQNVRTQSVPYPATAFRLDIFKKAKPSAHNPTFSDTEQTLKFLGYGKFLFSETETMLYRENPYSASHVLNVRERVMGASISLSKIFNSIEFEYVLDKVEKSKRSLFAKELMRAIECRIPESDLLKSLQILALENMIERWGYQEKNLILLLVQIYKSFSSSQTLGLIKNLNKSGVEITHIYNKEQKKEKISKRVWDKYFECKNPIIRKFNKIIIKKIYSLIFIFKRKHIFRNNWTK